MKIAFNLKTMKPGCALIQAALGCDPQMASLFDSKDWELKLSEDMKVYPIDNEQLATLVLMVEKGIT